MIGSCSSIDLQVNRKGGRLVIELANDRVYTVCQQNELQLSRRDCVSTTAIESHIIYIICKKHLM